MESLPSEILFYEDHGEGGELSIQQSLKLLNVPMRKKNALQFLVQEGQKFDDVAVLVWNSDDVNISRFLFEEINNSQDPNVVLDSMTILRWLAAHPATKLQMVRANLPVMMYPFMMMNDVTHIRNLEDIRVSGVGVIVRILEVPDDSPDPEIIRFLLETGIFPACLRCLEMGSGLAKKGAAFVMSQILMSREGQQYVGVFPDRYYAVAIVLRNTVDRLERRNSQLLKHLLNCFMELEQVSRVFRACDLSQIYPARLRNPMYLSYACEGDEDVRALADQVLRNVMGYVLQPILYNS